MMVLVSRMLYEQTSRPWRVLIFAASRLFNLLHGGGDDLEEATYTQDSQSMAVGLNEYALLVTQFQRTCLKNFRSDEIRSALANIRGYLLGTKAVAESR